MKFCSLIIAIIVFCVVTGCSPDYSAVPQKPASNETKASPPKAVEYSAIDLPGSCSLMVPDAFKRQMNETNQIEILNQDGVPVIFIATCSITNNPPGWISLVSDPVLAAFKFRAEQVELEDARTLEVEKYGVDSRIVKCNPPYPLPRLAQPAFGIDYVRHDKANAMGKHQECRVFCINIQIVDGHLLHTIHMKYFASPSTSVDANMPNLYSEMIQSITIAEKHQAVSSDPAKYASWETVSVPGICTFQIPPTMELQAGKYREMMDQARTRIFQITDSENRVVAQQKGLNALDAAARSRYARVIVATQTMSAGDFNLLDDPLVLSHAEIAEIDGGMKAAVEQEMKQSTDAGYRTELKSWGGTRTVRINGVDCILTEYSRSSKSAPPASVRLYKFMNNDRVHTVTISYRITESDLWAKDLEKVMATLQFARR